MRKKAYPALTGQLVSFVSGALLLMACTSCSRKAELPPLSQADSIAVIEDNLAHRAEVDRFFKSDPGSPFQRDSSVAFHGIRWFPIDPRYRTSSELHRYEKPETVVVLGTKGEQRKQLRYGYFALIIPDGKGAAAEVRLNVYKFTPYDGQRYTLYKDHLSVWFTDETTGRETYDVGRYLEIGTEDSDPAHVYTLDFNKAYNPYCAYTPLYSCAVPREEDHLAVALRAGEMKYHE
jgi:uncharacterized protein (DUF1684 family)